MTGRKHPAQSTGDAPSHWPEGVYPISIDGMDNVGVGDDGTLYWDGKVIEVRKTLALTIWQKLGAIAVSVSAIMAAGAAVFSAIADWTCR